MSYSKTLSGFPLIYLEIIETVMSGQPFVQKYDTEAKAKAVRLSFYHFRTALRKAHQADPGNVVLEKNYNDSLSINVSVKKDGTIVYDHIENGWVARSMREAHQKAIQLGLTKGE